MTDMLQLDIDTWLMDPAADLRVHAAARRARADLAHDLLVRFGARLGRKMRVPASWSAHVQRRVARG
jgi:hypothetical protein